VIALDAPSLEKVYGQGSEGTPIMDPRIEAIRVFVDPRIQEIRAYFRQRDACKPIMTAEVDALLQIVGTLEGEFDPPLVPRPLPVPVDPREPAPGEHKPVSPREPKPFITQDGTRLPRPPKPSKPK
jgi:hypothetical protein